MSNFLAPFFQLFLGKKKIYIVASALKSYLIEKLKKKLEDFFWG